MYHFPQGKKNHDFLGDYPENKGKSQPFGALLPITKWGKKIRRLWWWVLEILFEWRAASL